MSTETLKTPLASTQAIAEKLVALPSLTCDLSSLPEAKDLDDVSLHPNAFPGRHAAHSEAKLKKALARTSTVTSLSSSIQPFTYPSLADYDDYSSDESSLIIMKKSKKKKFST